MLRLSLEHVHQVTHRVDVVASCRGGGCGVCKVRIDSGEVRTEKMSRQHVSADEQALGLGCTTGLCRWRKGPWRIALVSDERRLVEACGSADIVLSTVDAQARCRLFGRPERPAVCGSLPPSAEMCGSTREHALHFLERLEQATRP